MSGGEPARPGDAAEAGGGAGPPPGGWPAPAAHPIHPLIARRWSPRGFADRPVEDERLASVFEAARWAPSSRNEQPWSYVLARRHGDPGWFRRLGSVLSEGNAWALDAPVLVLAVAQSRFRRNGRPNRHAWHDVGAASENMFLQAFAVGLVMHEMAGFDADAARELLDLPADRDPVAMIALGPPAEGVVEDARAEGKSRGRRPLSSFVFEGGWERPAGLQGEP